jgi:hypothetical protein
MSGKAAESKKDKKEPATPPPAPAPIPYFTDPINAR